MSEQAPDPKLTFLPTNQDHTLDQNLRHQTCPLNFAKHYNAPTQDSGDLERLPDELIDDVLAQADLQSLFNFRHVNRRAMQIADSIPEFKQIVKHGHMVLRAMLSIRNASHFSSIDLLRTLETRDCENCGDFAGHIYLLGCSRVCYLCFINEARYLPLTSLQVWRRFGLDRSRLQLLPRMTSLPGKYSPAERVCRRRLTLYDHDTARQAGFSLHASQAAIDKFTADDLPSQMIRYHRRNTEYLAGISRTKPRKPTGATNTEEVDMLETNPRRFMAVVSMPWIRPKEDIPVLGFHCRGCGDDCHRPFHWRRQYTNETFQDHIRQCGQLFKDERMQRYRHSR